eukprot:TRINITY_DN30341_c0_g1_i4.p1 TRINITY_DN30341_c0_g1~~TRINITY_DN30341_c0_g1_i4.p1  ORF type:complete len:175 (-),score=45.49 TRINITY_DN30341_c0_g1_i4:254-778(-)
MADAASKTSEDPLPPLTHAQLEEGSILRLDWKKLQKVAQADADVVPVCVQHADTKEVLILAYANELALAETIKTRTCVLWSTSRNQLWVKGATSGDTLDLVDVLCNCEQNSLLYLVRPRRLGACHTKGPDGMTRPSCYYRRLQLPEIGSCEVSALSMEHLGDKAAAAAATAASD